MISAIIPNYNTKELVRRCLQSLENEPLIKEIIVVDNNSSDGSVEYLKSLRGIKIVFNQKNLGFAKAVNQGIGLAREKYFLLLNSDTEMKKKTLEKLIDFAEKTPNLGILAPRLVNRDGSPQASCYYFPSVLGAIKEFWLGKKGAFSKYLPPGEKPKVVDVAVGAVWLIPGRIIEKIGFLNEKFFIYFEDFDFCARVKKAGCKVYYFPGAEAFHLHGGSSKKIKDKPNQWLIESSKIYHGSLKHYLINFIIWSGQKWRKLRSLFS